MLQIKKLGFLLKGWVNTVAIVAFIAFCGTQTTKSQDVQREKFDWRIHFCLRLKEILIGYYVHFEPMTNGVYLFKNQAGEHYRSKIWFDVPRYQNSMVEINRTEPPATIAVKASDPNSNNYFQEFYSGPDDVSDVFQMLQAEIRGCIGKNFNIEVSDGPDPLSLSGGLKKLVRATLPGEKPPFVYAVYFYRTEPSMIFLQVGPKNKITEDRDN